MVIELSVSVAICLLIVLPQEERIKQKCKQHWDAGGGHAFVASKFVTKDEIKIDNGSS